MSSQFSFLKKTVECSFKTGSIFTVHPNEEGKSKYIIGDETSTTNIRYFQTKMFESLNVKTKKEDIDFSTLGKLFFSKHCSVPRYKVKEVKEKHNLSVVRDASKADTIIVSKDELVKMSKHTYMPYHYDKKFVVDTIKELIDDPITKSVNSRLFTDAGIEEALSEIEKIPEEVECISFKYYSNDKFREAFEALHLHGDCFYGTYSIDGEDYDQFMSYQGKTIITDDLMQSILGSCAMDKDSYEFVNKLFSSNEDGNVELALTMMANCNFEESKHYLLLLMKDYYGYYRYNKYCNTVAFKSLLEYLNVTRYSVFSYDNILSVAYDMGKLTDEFKDIITKRITEEVSQSHVFKCRWIKLVEVSIEKPNDE